MELSEGKLFTIEALNRIEGFEWPEWANYASMCCDGGHHWFWSDKPISNGEMFSASGMVNAVLIGPNHPDWKNSRITREEFESVDGWVRNDGVKPNIADDCRADLTLRDGNVWPHVIVNDLNWGLDNNHDDIIKWRYYKQPQNQVEQPTQQPIATIETLICQHKAAKQSTLEARRQLEHAEAIEHNLLLSIEAWAESNGFDISLLDESEERPELVVTDWRDLRAGDVIECVIVCGGGIKKGDLGVINGIRSDELCAKFDRQSDYFYKKSHFGVGFKFIRRPDKGEKQ